MALAPLALACLLLPYPARAQADDPGPVAVIRELQSGLLRIDTALAQAGFAERYAAFRELVTASHQLDYMARVALRRHWNELSPQQQQTFTDKFRRLSIARYADRFRDLGGAVFTITSHRELPHDRVEVRSTLSVPGERPVEIDYVLQYFEPGWRIINIVARGVSDLALKRAQYRKIMEGPGFTALLEHLDKQIGQLAAD